MILKYKTTHKPSENKIPIKLGIYPKLKDINFFFSEDSDIKVCALKEGQKRP